MCFICIFSAGVGRSGTFIALDRVLQSLNDPTKVNNYIDVYGIVYAMRKERVWMVQTEQQYICIHQCIVCILKQNDGDQQDLLLDQDMELMNSSASLTATSMMAHHNRAFEGTSSLILNSNATTFIVRCGIMWLSAAVLPKTAVAGGFWSKRHHYHHRQHDHDTIKKPTAVCTTQKNTSTMNMIVMTNTYNRPWWTSCAWTRWARKSNTDCATHDVYRL